MYLLTLLLFMVIGIIYMAAVSSGSGLHGLVVFIDVPSLLIMFLFTVPMIVSSGLLKDFNNAFRFSIRQKEKVSRLELFRAIEAVSFVIKLLWTAGILAMTATVLSTLGQHAEENIRFSGYFAISMEPLVYAAFLVLFLLPVRARLNVRMGTLMYGGGQEEKSAGAVCGGDTASADSGHDPV